MLADETDESFFLCEKPVSPSSFCSLPQISTVQSC